jgi:cytochrome c-type biogenesis protein
MSGTPLPLAAFIAGLLSFLSPCVLPLVPGYVSLISGTGVESLAHERRALRAVMLNSITFILGFSIVFIMLGAGATALGQLVGRFRRDLTFIAGIVIIVFGLHLTGVLKIKALYADKRLHDVKGGSSPLGAFFVGFAFAFGWTPCIGPILAGILTLAAAEETVTKGMGLLAIYSAGLAVPFLLTSLGVDRFLSFYGRFRRHLHAVEVASGVLLIVLGALVLTGRFTVLSGYLSFLNRFAL